MNRRDFLRMWVKDDEHVLELSCERLYMRYVDAESSAGGEATVASSWDGEPPTEIVTQSIDELFAELDRRLAAADTMRLLGTEWLRDPGFRVRVDRSVETFRVRGGHVEVSDSAATAQ
jgi:hypothetical protein